MRDVQNPLHMHHDISHGTQHEKCEGLNTPSGTDDIPYIYHDILTVMKIPYGTQDTSHGAQDSPHIYHDILHST